MNWNVGTMFVLVLNKNQMRLIKTGGKLIYWASHLNKKTHTHNQNPCTQTHIDVLKRNALRCALHFNSK